MTRAGPAQCLALHPGGPYGDKDSATAVRELDGKQGSEDWCQYGMAGTPGGG